MKKKGFTLVEIIAIILVIAIVLLIAIPAVAKHIKTGKNKINTSNESTLELAAREYFSEHRAQLPSFNEYSLVLGTVLRDLNYLPDDLKDGDGGSCDASYVVIENKNGVYIYHVCMNCDNYKTNGVFCDKKPEVPESCKDGNCRPTCVVAPKETKDSNGKDITYRTGTWTNKDIVFAVVGEKNTTTKFPIKAARIYVDGQAVVEDMQKAGKGLLGTKPKVYNNEKGQTYFEYNFTQVGLFGMYGVSTVDKLIGARVLDVGPYYSELCTYKVGTKIVCDGDGCDVEDIDECTGPDCNPDTTCDDNDPTCTPPTDDCKPGEVCVDKLDPWCTATYKNNVITVEVGDTISDKETDDESIRTSHASGVSKLVNNTTGQTMTTNTYSVTQSGTYGFTVYDRAGNKSTCETKVNIEKSTVKYNCNGGTGTPPTEATFNAGSKYTIANNTCSAPTGFTFTKWNTKADGTGTSYTQGQNKTWKGKVDITLYAQWEDNTKPSCTLTITGTTKGGWYNVKPKATINAKDNGQTVTCGSNGMKCEFVGTNLGTYYNAKGEVIKDGSFTIEAQVTDANGNTSKKCLANVKVDTGAPTACTISLDRKSKDGDYAGWYNSTTGRPVATVSGSTDNGSKGLTYKFTGGVTQNSTDKKYYVNEGKSTTRDTRYTVVTATVTDAAGNSNTCSKTVWVDIHTPTLDSRAAGRLNCKNSAGAQLAWGYTVKAHDNLSGTKIQYSKYYSSSNCKKDNFYWAATSINSGGFNNGSGTAYKDPVLYTIFAGCSNNPSPDAYFKLCDAAGNCTSDYHFSGYLSTATYSGYSAYSNAKVCNSSVAYNVSPNRTTS